MTLEEAIRHPDYAYTRTRQWCGQWIATVYHRVASSPSGVLAVHGDTDEIVTACLYRCGKTSPLGPGER